MIKIECLKDYSEVNTRTYTDKKSGEIKEMASQFLFVHLGGPFPEKINVSIEDKNNPIQVGVYKLGLDAFQVGQFDRLEINSFNLAKSLIKA